MRTPGIATAERAAVRVPHIARAHAPAQQSAPALALHRALGNRATGAFLQTKLEVGPPGDRYEQEADRVADTVMRMSEPSVQRCSCSGGSGAMCADCAESEELH
jgi:hypothetical protein